MTGTIHQLKNENQGKLGSKLMDVIRTLKKKHPTVQKLYIYFTSQK